METSLDPFSLPDGKIPAHKRHAGTRHAGDALRPLRGGGGASGAAVTKDRPLLQRDQESPDYDMPADVDMQTSGCTSHVECVSSLHMPNATMGWDLMRLHTMRHTSLTGDVKTVAVLNGMQTASFQVMNR